MEFYIAIILFAFSTTITPGPNNVMIMTSGMNYGIKQSLPHFLGICIGFPIMLMLEGIGFSFIFERYPILNEVIQVIGIVYLIYLAWLIANAAPSSLNGKKRKPLSFLQAVLFQWVNPKAWVMATSAVSAYATWGADTTTQVFIISMAFLLVGFPCVGSWLLFGAQLKQWLQKDSSQRLFNITMACLLIASILPAIQSLMQKYI